MILIVKIIYNQGKREKENTNPMVVVRISQRTLSVFEAILVYVKKVCFSSSNDHPLFLIGFEDKENNRCIHPKKSSDIKEPFYVIDPLQTNRIPISWEGETLSLTMQTRDDHHLYKAPDVPSVNEPVQHLLLESEKQETIDRFLKECMDYFSKWDTIKHLPQTLVVYQWVDEEYWEKLKTMEKRSIDTIYLPKRDEVLQDLQTFYSEDTKNIYTMFGVPYRRSYCFYGPPGTGKSSFTFSLASECNKGIALMNFSHKTDDQSLIRAVNTLPKDVVLLLEDVDCLMNRDSKQQVSFSALLNCLDGIHSKEGIVVFITTNHYKHLDPALLRPGRIDYLFEFGHTTPEQIRMMLQKFFPSQEARYDEFIERTKGWRLTTCMLQKFFFLKYPEGNILEQLETLRKEVQQFRWPPDSNDSSSMYA